MEMLNTQKWLKLKIGFMKPLVNLYKNEIMHELPFWTVFIVRLQFSALLSSHHFSAFYVTFVYITKEQWKNFED
jgi:hypothetical protein